MLQGDWKVNAISWKEMLKQEKKWNMFKELWKSWVLNLLG